MSQLIAQSAVKRMTDKCAPGSTWTLGTHSYKVKFGGRCYPSLPKHAEIEIGHIRKMVRHLQIDRKCATAQIPALKLSD